MTSGVRTPLGWLLALFLLFVYACGGQSSSSDATTTTASPATTGAVQTATTAPEPSDVEPGEPSAPDEMEALISAAQEEGILTWYTSINLPTSEALSAAFEAQYGVAVDLFRTGGTSVIERFRIEVDANNIVADVLTATDSEAFNTLGAEGLLEPYFPVGFAQFVPEVRNEEGYWIAARILTKSIGFRSDLESADEMPVSWGDLANAAYAGKVVIADPAFSAITAGEVAMLSRMFGWEFFEALAANDTMVVQGAGQVSDAILSGERTIAPMGHDDALELQEEHGLDLTLIDPTEGSFVVASPIGLVANSRSPNAGKLFMEFIASQEGQQIIADNRQFPARTDVELVEGLPQLTELDLIPIDAEYFDSVREEVLERFSEIFDN